MTESLRRAGVATAALASLLILVLAGVLTACGDAPGFPDREPDAAGTLFRIETVSDSGAETFRLVVDEGEYPYYWNAVLSFDGDTVVGDQTGHTLSLDDLSEGQWVEVWTDACWESYPVQCDVTHVRLTAVDDLGM
jgi:hypothetical protein